MRDAARMSRVLSLFSRLWLKMPDMRFFQLIKYIESKLPEGSFQHMGYAPETFSSTDIDTIGLIDGRDTFNTEDDVLEVTLRRLIDELP